MHQIIDAFNYIHNKRIIHRNIKLENILIKYDNEEDAKNYNLMKAEIKISHLENAYRVPNFRDFDFPYNEDDYDTNPNDPYFISKQKKHRFLSDIDKKTDI